MDSSDDVVNATKYIVLDKIRTTLNFLRKANVFNEVGQTENPILASFRELQNTIRYSEFGKLHPSDLVGPFLSLINSLNMSSPYKLVAMDSIQLFLECNVLSGAGSQTSDALAGIVQAVTTCRFVQTEPTFDDLMPLRIVQLLHCIVSSNAFTELLNSTLWNILEFCLASTLRNGGARKHQAVYRESEAIILSVIRLLFTKSVITSNTNERSGVVSLLSYSLTYLTAYSRKLMKDGKLIPLERPNNKNYEAQLLNENTHVEFCLKIVHSILLSQGHVSNLQKLILTQPELYRVLVDDLGYCILTLLQHRNDTSPTQLLPVCLTIFSTLKLALGPCVGVVTEWFMKQVYIKTILQVAHVFTGEKTSSKSDTVMSIEDIEVVLESLCDLVSDVHFIPSLYASFDSNPTKPDIVYPLIEHIAKCCCAVLNSGPEDLGQYRDVGILVVQLHRHVLNTFGMRQKKFELYHDDLQKSLASACAVSSPVAAAAAVNGSSTSITGANNSNNASQDASNRVQTLKALFKAGRLSKLLLVKAATLFNEKPELGLRYLQDQNMLPTPLTATSVANFLRNSPQISKENVGAFLGEFGKDNASYEGNSKQFHADVLLAYVRTFAFEQQSVLDCMRIFLSAFRLPGEAQQIDRILVAFSEFCHSYSIEGVSGQVENAEVCYLLSFSIIMLNTDRHNPNIRADRRMTTEQFIRNNTNYGKDVNQTIPLVREYLEGIYASISEHPIRTEGHDLSAMLTLESWKEMQLTSFRDPTKNFLWSTNYDTHFITALSGMHKTYLNGIESVSFKTVNSEKSSNSNNNTGGGNNQSSDVNFDNTTSLLIRNMMLSTNATVFGNPFELTAHIQGIDWLVDEDLFDVVLFPLLQVATCVHTSNYRVVTTIDKQLQNDRIDTSSEYFTRERIGRLLFLSNEFLIEMLRICKGYGMYYCFDFVVLLLSGFCGALTEPFTDKLITFVMSGGQNVAALLEGPSAQSSVAQVDVILNRLLHFPSARAVFQLQLSIVQNNHSCFRSWSLIWYLLCVLRDATLLPLQMVTEKEEEDLLPVQIRQDFEHSLSLLDKAIIDSHLPTPSPSVKRRASQSLFDVFFGNNSTESPTTSESDEPSVDVNAPAFKNSLPSARWDSGYEGVSKHGAENAPDDKTPIELLQLTKETVPLEDVRVIVKASTIEKLVSDSRYMADASLFAFVTALVNTIEHHHHHSDDTSSTSAPAVPTYRSSYALIANTSRFAKWKSVSHSSVSWLEILLVDVALRNRDRFVLIWPILELHYTKTLCGHSTSAITYVHERRIVGLLKIATRMISRYNLSESLIRLLGSIFIRSDESNTVSSRSLLRTLRESSVTVKAKYPVGMSNQIAAGIWTLLTLNVDILPSLPLEQWQIIFRIIALNANGGSYAVIKSFEAMAWLLHEPRLVAKVPVFCIIGVKPLLLNADAPLSVSVGAVQLLFHLHSRLEVLIKDSNDEEGYEGVDSEESNTMLWESCWLPILHTLAEGVADSRLLVRESVVDALVKAVSDRHSFAVPTGVLVQVLTTIYIPLVTFLNECVKKESTDASVIIPASVIDGAVTTVIPSIGTSRDASHKILHENWVKIEMTGDLSDASTVSSVVNSSGLLNVGSIFEKSLSGLCSTFLRNIDKLRNFPAFDKLWLNLLDLFGTILKKKSSPDKVTHNADTAPDKTLPNVDEDSSIPQKVDFASVKLLDVLTVLLQEGIFVNRESLWKITLEMIQQFRCGSLGDLSLGGVIVTNSNNNYSSGSGVNTSGNNSVKLSS